MKGTVPEIILFDPVGLENNIVFDPVGSENTLKI